MVDIKSLSKQVLKLLEDKKEDNYRVCIIIVGPPGSGKSTIAEKLTYQLNQQYNEYLQHHPDVQVKTRQHDKIDLTSKIKDISPLLNDKLMKDQGIFKDLVEDTDFKPVKQKLADGSFEIMGRGGKPNSFTVSDCNLESNNVDEKNIQVAQIIPMDGFHLSRNSLDCFRDPEWAHQRRGSPMTFDSNNFLELCDVLAQTSLIRPNESSKGNCFEFLSDTFIENFPEIKIPGFDHRLKDPTPHCYSINGYTRIMIFEGLYLLYNQENWQKAYELLAKTGALLVWNVDIEEGVIQERVGKRHLQTGIVSTLEDGIKRFQKNDLVNARLIKDNLVNDKNIIHIRND